ncbi:hypothetical protein FRB97_006679 [Tulasnella sp. 331]|nr:hypothetical protein FRB97_006679 [Tulasnella sp. 331]
MRSGTPPPHPVVDLRHVEKTRLHITEDELQLKDNENILKRIEDLRQLAVKHRDTLLETVAYKRSIIAPIRRLPFELLGMVFTELVEIAMGSPLRCLALVCKRWGYVVKNTPACWSRLHIAPFLQKSFSIDGIYKSLASAGAYPLALKLDFSTGRARFNAPLAVLYSGMDEVHGAVEDHAWRELQIIAHLRISTREVLEPFIAHLLRNKYPTALASLSFDVYRSEGPLIFFDFTDDNEKDLEKALKKCTSLTSLAMPAQAIPISHSVLSRLTHLHLKFVTSLDSKDAKALPKILTILSESSVLTSLTLSRVGEPYFQGAVPVITRFLKLAAVESLDIGGWGNLDRLFLTVEFPSLRSLTLQSTRDVLETKFLFHAMIEGRATVQLTKLNLYGGVAYSESDLIWFLERLPTLVELHILASTKLSQKTLGALSKEPTVRKPWICPKLKVFVIGAGCSKVTRTDVMHLVDKRVTDVPEKHAQVIRRPKKGRKAVKAVKKTQVPPIRMLKVTLADEDMIIAALKEQENQNPQESCSTD